MKKELYISDKIILCNASQKIKKDLEYIFPNVCFKLETEAVSEMDSEWRYAVDCSLDYAEVDTRFSLKAYTNKANYLYSKADREIVVFGTGVMAKILMEQWDKLYPGLCVDFFVDNDVTKQNTYFANKKIYSPDCIDLSKHFVVVCMQQSEAVEKQLINMGLKKEYDFIGFRTVLQDVGTALYKTLMDTEKHNFVCPLPFGFVDIINDDVFLCCPASLHSISIGNIHDCQFESVWKSVYANVIRLSIINGTYSFCDESFCSRYDLHERAEKSIERDYTLRYKSFPQNMLIGLDSTCNLSCPSCREKVRVESKEMYHKKWILADKILDSVQNKDVKICLAGDGEVFFSPLYKKMMLDSRFTSRNEISILSNGTLLDKAMWDQYLDNYDNIEIIISMDGASKATYEKLRRGGDYDKLIQNLQFLSQLRAKGKIQRLQINFVIQAANVGELQDMVVLCRKYNIDLLKVLKLYDYKMYEQEIFEEMSIVDEAERNIKQPYRKYFTEEVLNDKIIDWYFMAPYVGKNSGPHLLGEYSLF